MRRLVRKIDTDGDGTVSSVELLQVFVEHEDQQDQAEELEEAFKTFLASSVPRFETLLATDMAAEREIDGEMVYQLLKSCVGADILAILEGVGTMMRVAASFAPQDNQRQPRAHSGAFAVSEDTDSDADLRDSAISGAILTPRALAHGRRRMEDLPGLLNSSGAGKANADRLM